MEGKLTCAEEDEREVGRRLGGRGSREPPCACRDGGAGSERGSDEGHRSDRLRGKSTAMRSPTERRRARVAAAYSGTHSTLFAAARDGQRSSSQAMVGDWLLTRRAQVDVSQAVHPTRAPCYLRPPTHRPRPKPALNRPASPPTPPAARARARDGTSPSLRSKDGQSARGAE